MRPASVPSPTTDHSIPLGFATPLWAARATGTLSQPPHPTHHALRSPRHIFGAIEYALRAGEGPCTGTFTPARK